MKLFNGLCLSVPLALLFLWGGSCQRVVAEDRTEVVAGEVLVGVRTGSDDAAEPARLSSVVGRVVGYQPELHAYRMRLYPQISLQTAIASLQQHGEVLYAEPNHVLHAISTPNDTFYGNQYGPRKVQADLAWGIWQPSAQIIIAIVDTGIDNTHPDLTNKIYRNPADQGIMGYNAFTGVRSDAKDDFGHGTHCAGIAAAQTNNGTGVAGIAGWNGVAGSTDTFFTKLMPVKVLDSTGSGTDATVAAGITWAANNGARVISMSLGGGGSSTLSNAVAYAWGKGCVVVAAAGNSGSSAPSYPAGYPNVISVAATDSTDKLASYSNYGSWVTVAAPGSSVYSTTPTYAAGGGFTLNYAYLSGTSMACPHVAGEAALILAQNPTLTNSQVANLISTNVDPYTPYSGSIAPGSGRINVYRALQAAGTGAPSAPATPANLTATAGDMTVALSWTASAGASSYNIYRGTAANAEVQVASGVAAASYNDSGLTDGVKYYYRVSATNNVGTSGLSNEVSATPQKAVGPPPPSTLTAVADSYVRAGVYSANVNYGAANPLVIGTAANNNSNSNNRAAYLKFDLTQITSAPTSATLTLTVNSGSYPYGSTETVGLYDVANTSWTESGITFNNAPSLNTNTFTSSGTLVTTFVAPLKIATISIDLTAYVTAHLGQIVTLQLIDQNADSKALYINSKESAAGKPTITTK